MQGGKGDMLSTISAALTACSGGAGIRHPAAAALEGSQ